MLLNLVVAAILHWHVHLFAEQLVGEETPAKVVHLSSGKGDQVLPSATTEERPRPIRRRESFGSDIGD